MNNEQQTSFSAAKGFLKPDEVVAQLDIFEGMKIADFGSGTGFFAILFAQKVGEKGEITAIDVLSSAIESLASRAKDLGITNIKLVRANLEVPNASSLENDSQDMVFMANILFQSNKKDLILDEAKRILKNGGDLVVIEWIPEKIKTEGLYKISKEEMKQLAESKGFKFIREFYTGGFHYGLLFKK